MLERHHTKFRREGAALDPAKKKRLAAIIERLAALGTAFSQNVLADEQSYAMELDGEADLAGLPDFRARSGAPPRPTERGMNGKHVITLQRSSVEPFLQFSSRRDLREKAFRAWIARGDNGGKTDNKALIAEMMALRIERAKLLGYPTFAQYRLDDAMAKTPEAVRGLLEKVWKPARKAALADRDALQELIAEEGGNFKLAAVGLALLRREASRAALRFRGIRGQAVFPARPHDRGGVLRRAEAVRADVPSGRGAGLASRRAGLGGARRGRRPRRHLLRRLFRAARASMAAPGWARCATRRSSPATCARSSST